MKGNIIKTAKRRIPEGFQEEFDSHWCVVPTIEYRKPDNEYWTDAYDDPFLGRIRLYLTPKNGNDAIHHEVFDSGWATGFQGLASLSDTARGMTASTGFLEDILHFQGCQSLKSERFMNYLVYQDHTGIVSQGRKH